MVAAAVLVEERRSLPCFLFNSLTPHHKHQRCTSSKSHVIKELLLLLVAGAGSLSS